MIRHRESRSGDWETLSSRAIVYQEKERCRRTLSRTGSSIRQLMMLAAYPRATGNPDLDFLLGLRETWQIALPKKPTRGKRGKNSRA
jgi:hypothetical protein